MNTTPQLPPEQLARILGTKFYAARHPVEFEAALAELTAIIRERDEILKVNEAVNRLLDKAEAERDSYREKAEALDAIQSKPNQSSSA